MKSDEYPVDNEFYAFSVLFIINYPLSYKLILIRPSYIEIPYPERNDFFNK